MFDALSRKFDQILNQLRSRGVLTEEHLAETLKDVRLALLEADVHFKIVKDFIERVRVKALGQHVLDGLTPGQQVIKIVWDELRDLMGHEQVGIRLAPEPPTVLMLIGLQGAGKTTTCAKLARLFKRQGKRVLLVAADPRRPAAAEQLASLGAMIDVPVHRVASSLADVVQTCQAGVERGRREGFDVVVLDTGGRLHIDEDLMAELAAIKQAVEPHEVLLVADAMTGQDAVTMAEQFERRVGLTGVILTKVEGDARGGAVLSIRAATGRPIKYLGVGEKLDALEPFHPDRIASRVLGMGDVLSLVERVQEALSKDEAERQRKLMTSKAFTLEDFRDQLLKLTRLGSMDDLLGMLPGGQRLRELMGGGATPQREIARMVAIINSMTPRERRDHTILNGSRKRRIARGSGTTVQDVNRLIKQFLSARAMIKAMSGGGRFQRQLAQMLGIR
jgi:signal recognition particle subunit SRP54